MKKFFDQVVNEGNARWRYNGKPCKVLRLRVDVASQKVDAHCIKVEGETDEILVEVDQDGYFPGLEYEVIQ